VRIKGLSRSVLALGASAIAIGAVPALSATAANSAGGTGTVHQSAVNSAHPGTGSAGTSNNLSYHGGVPGVEIGGDKVYLVYWGSQWNNNDTSGEAAIQQSFFNGVGGSSWNNSVTQYCQGVATGTQSCNGAGTAATNPAGVLGGFWYDNSTAAPKHPTQSQLGNEAIRAAVHFNNTTAASNSTVQYVIATAHGNNSRGFGSRYCAWHSSTSSTSTGTIAYTNMPYITDAGASCGANFNSLGPNAGITIVGGHEFAETETDIFPNGGWLDGNGAENGDKCAWVSSGQGASANVSMNGATFPVQSLWSNAFNRNAGGCVLSYP
jgi:serine protease